MWLGLLGLDPYPPTGAALFRLVGSLWTGLRRALAEASVEGLESGHAPLPGAVSLSISQVALRLPARESRLGIEI